MRAASRSSTRSTAGPWRSRRHCRMTCRASATPISVPLMPDRRYPLIVFDWDGTLFDSAAVITDCIQEAARDMALPVPDRRTASHVIGLGLNDSLRLALPELAADRYPDFLARYRRYFVEREDA